jgi:hypothetical protein
MQSYGAEVAGWRAFRWPGTPHNPRPRREAMSMSCNSALHCLGVGTGRAGRRFSACFVFPTRANECGVRKTHMTDHLYIFDKSPEQLRRLGARGGRACGRNRRVRRALLATPPKLIPARVSVPTTTAESIAVLDAHFPWLRGAEKRLT